MKVTYFGLIFWIADAAMAMFALVAILLRGKRREWPALVLFLSVKVGAEAAQAIAFQYSYKTYFYTFWSTVTLEYLSQFFLLYAIIVAVLKTFPRTPKGFQKALIFLLVIAAVSSAVFAASTHADFGHWVPTLCIALQRCLLAAWVASFIACSIATSRLGLGWTRDSLFLGGGMLAMNTSAVFVVLSFGYFRSKHISMDHLQSIVEISVFLFWAVGLKTAALRCLEGPPLGAERIAAIKAIANSTGIGARKKI